MRGPRTAFSLLELLISSTLAMIMVGLAVSAFLQTRKQVQRSEKRLEMHAAAQRLHTYLHRTLSSVQQSCVFVGFSTAASNSHLSDDPGSVKLVFMRGKEHQWDFDPTISASASDSVLSSDLVWEVLEWRRGSGELRDGASSQGTAAAPGRRFQAKSPFALPTGVDYGGKWFQVAAQPRRWVDPTSVATVVAGLNDNLLFPDSSTPPVSLANPLDDLGDLSDAQRNMTPILDHISDLAIELVSQDGTVTTLNDAVTRDPPVVFQGVWLDGRMANTLEAAPVWSGSAVSKRPQLLRLRFTLVDQLKRPDLSFTFSFSFALPGLSHGP